MRRTVIALAAAPLAAMPAAAQTPPAATPAILPDGTLLDVNAEGKSTRVPDLATIRAGVVTQAATAAAALSENAARMDRVLAALTGAGLAARDSAPAHVHLSPPYRYGQHHPPALPGLPATH